MPRRICSTPSAPWSRSPRCGSGPTPGRTARSPSSRRQVIGWGVDVQVDAGCVEVPCVRPRTFSCLPCRLWETLLVPFLFFSCVRLTRRACKIMICGMDGWMDGWMDILGAFFCVVLLVQAFMRRPPRCLTSAELGRFGVVRHGRGYSRWRTPDAVGLMIVCLAPTVRIRMPESQLWCRQVGIAWRTGKKEHAVQARKGMAYGQERVCRTDKKRYAVRASKSMPYGQERVYRTGKKWYAVRARKGMAYGQERVCRTGKKRYAVRARKGMPRGLGLLMTHDSSCPQCPQVSSTPAFLLPRGFVDGFGLGSTVSE